jgi:hypothetical protein
VGTFEFSVLVFTVSLNRLRGSASQPEKKWCVPGTSSGGLGFTLGHQFTGSGLVCWLLGVNHQPNNSGSGFGCLLGAGSCECLPGGDV